MKIYLGTSNQYKIRDLSLVAPYYSRFFKVVPEVHKIVEYGATFIENAKIKMAKYSDFLPEEEQNNRNIVIAEDSGIEIPAFNGLPGIYSARFNSIVLNHKHRIICFENIPETDRDSQDADNNRRIIEMMIGAGKEELDARFVCAMVACTHPTAGHRKVIAEAVGYLEGKVIAKPRGDNGFGYDPIFVPHNSGEQTMAELDFFRKNLRSHRRIAGKKLFEKIEEYYDVVDDKKLRIVLEGNDGTGKTTLKKYLEMMGHTNVCDRGEITSMFIEGEKGTTNPSSPAENTLYIVLDATPHTCQQRIQERGGDVTEKYHTYADLLYWRNKFLKIAESHSDFCKVVSTEMPIQEQYKQICIAAFNMKLKFC